MINLPGKITRSLEPGSQAFGVAMQTLDRGADRMLVGQPSDKAEQIAPRVLVALSGRCGDLPSHGTHPVLEDLAESWKGASHHSWTLLAVELAGGLAACADAERSDTRRRRAQFSLPD